MDSDVRGGLYLRLLHDDPQVGDLEKIAEWELSESGEQLLDSLQKIDNQIEGLKRFQLMMDDPQPQTRCERLLKAKTKKQKWNESILKGVVFKKIKVIENLAKQEKEWKLLVDNKNKEIRVLRTEVEEKVELLVSICPALTKGLQEKEDEIAALTKELEEKEDEIAAVRREACFYAEQAVEKSKLTEKLAEMDSKIGDILAEQDLLMKKHTIECNLLKSEANAFRTKTERMERKFKRFSRALRNFGRRCGVFSTTLEYIAADDADDDHLEKEITDVFKEEHTRMERKFKRFLTALRNFGRHCAYFTTTLEYIAADDDHLEELSITCLNSGNVEAEREQTTRKRQFEGESSHGPRKRQRTILEEMETESEN